jgi:hypothetical protein
MNIYEVAERHKISLKKLRAMDKDKLLRLDESANASDPIRATLMNGDPLPVRQLVQLIEEPGLLLDLGKYTSTAEAQIAALGKPQNEIAPKPVAAAVTDAAKNDPEAVAILVAWLKEIIPPHPVGHAYIATRLLLGIPESIRKQQAPRIGRALLNCRNHPSFAGWWSVKPGVSQNSTAYQKLALDL